ncbi:hypothetical protein MY4824_004859 [Beauveria thailandica]
MAIRSPMGVAGEEDDVVQLKAVWVSGPSRIDSESSRKSEEDQSGKEVRVEKPDDEASRPHESKARGQSKVPFTNAIITKLPFFTWKTSLCDAKDDFIKGTVINRLLENANEILVAREVVGKLYDKAYMCSPLNFEERYHDWMKLPSPVPSRIDDFLSHCAEEHISVALPTDVGGPTEMTSRIAVECTDGLINHVSAAETIDQEFYLDGTFILTHDGDEDQDDENRSVQTPVSSSCHVPSNSETGPNTDFETRRQAARKIREPSRKHVKDAVRVEPKMLADPSTDIFGLFIPAELRTNHPLTERYWGSLDRIFRISTPNDGKSGASVSMPSSSGPAPSLTKDLVDAFEDIVMAHIIKAKHLSLANHWMFDGDDPNNRGAGASAAPAGSARRIPSAEFLTKVEDMIRCGAECLARAHCCLDHARTNLILLSTRTAMGAKISLDYIGIEFLVAVLSHPAALLELYQKYTAKLQFEANRKPRRRVFLDIQTLQEELDALRSKLLGNYRDLTAPRLSETMNPARENLYPLESQHIEKPDGRVKQSIEILEEGHGKAIRVFTIVTLFFLPLSFISSFFGMNVADIRETKSNQPIFWSIALPVTLGVLAIAFLYGYKWDSMVGWFESLLDGIRESRKAQNKTAADTRVMQPLGFSRGSKQQEGKQTGAETERTSQWSWRQVEQDYLRFRMPKRTATSKTIGE